MTLAISTHGSFLYILSQDEKNYTGTWWDWGDYNFRRFTAPAFNIIINACIEVYE